MIAEAPKPRPRRRRRTAVVAALLGLFVAYAVVFTVPGCADLLVIHPSRSPADPRGASRRTVPFKSGELEIWTARSPGARDGEAGAYVLEFCGSATRAEWITTYVAERFGRRPVEAWVVNYPGFGGSTGPCRLGDIPAVADLAYGEIAKAAGGKPVFVCGNSLGSAPALYVGARHPCAGMILQNPPALREVILGQHGWWNLWLVAYPLSRKVPVELDSIGNAGKTHSPAVFILSDGDTTVRPDYQKRIVDAYAGSKRVVPLHGDHMAPVVGEAERRLQGEIDWLWGEAFGPGTRPSGGM